jgi:biotin-(acetyl-CoA carboxylase) ligase
LIRKVLQPATANLLMKYRSYLAIMNQLVVVHQGEESYEAVVLDIDASGQLLVQKSCGEIVLLLSAEVSIKHT